MIRSSTRRGAMPRVAILMVSAALFVAGWPQIPAGATTTLLPNGDFETGTLSGWTSSGVNDGFANVVQQGTCGTAVNWSAYDTTEIGLPGTYSAIVRPSGPAPADSAGILTSDAFTAGDAINFDALSETTSNHENPSTFQVSLLDSNDPGHVLVGPITVQPNTLNLTNLCPGPSIYPSYSFSTHTIDTSIVSGQQVELQFEQHTNYAGLGYFTAIDDVSVTSVAHGISNVSLTDSTEGPTSPGITEANLSSLPIGKITQQTLPDTTPTNSAPFGKAPFGKAPFGKAPFGKAPFGKAPFGKAPFGKAPFGKAPFGKAPFGKAGLANTPFGKATLAQIPIIRSGGWPAILAQTANYANTTAQNVSLQQLFSDPNVMAGSIPALDPSSGDPLTVDQLLIGDSPLANLSLFSFLMGSLTWGDVTPPPSDGADGWATEWAEIPGCSSLSLASTILESEAEGCEISLTNLPLAHVGDILAPEKTVFMGLTVRDANVPGSFLADIPITAIPAPESPTPESVVNCSDPDVHCIESSQTLGDIAALDDGSHGNPWAADESGAATGTFADLGSAISGNTLSDVVSAFIDPTWLPWEDLPLAQAGLEKMNPPTVNFITYDLHFSLGCADSAGLTASVTPPPGFLYRPGSSLLSAGNMEGSTDPGNPDQMTNPGRLTWDLSEFACSGTPDQTVSYDLTFDAMPGFTVGTFSSSAFVSTSDLDGVGVDHTDPVTVASAFTGDGTPGSATPVGTNTMIVGNISGPGDVHDFSFTADPGQQVQVSLSHLGYDSDLVLYAPDGAQQQTPLRNPADVRAVPFGTDPLADPSASSGPLPPAALQDVPFAADKTVAGISAFRGTDSEYLSTTAVAGTGESPNTYIAQVSSGNGGFGDGPFVLIIRTSEAASLPACPARVFPNTSTLPTPTPTSIGATVNTLFLVDTKRLGDAFGDTAANDILASLNNLVSAASTMGVNAAVVKIDAYTQVNTDFAALDANPCSPEMNNNVVRDINDVVDGLKTTGNNKLANLRNIVIVGDDAIIPHARIEDQTADGNEAGFAGDTIFGGKSNELTGAFGNGFFLSDTPYASLSPLSVLGQVLYLPQVAFGRLGGDATTIQAELDQFVSSTGMADPRTLSTAPKTAAETDYDFFTDGGQQQANNLAANGDTVTRLTGPWTSVGFKGAVLGATPPAIIAANAHYDQYRMLPGDGDTSNIVTSADVGTLGSQALRLRVFLSIGCHAALDFPDVIGGTSPSGSEQTRLYDWEQAYQQEGTAVMIGNLGYGIGDTSTVGFDEQLLASLTKNLDGTRSVGQALVDAESSYFSGMASFSPYDLKVLQENALWGLPMYRVPSASGGGSVTVAASVALAVAQLSTDPISGLDSTTISVSPTFTKVSAPGGTAYFSGPDGAQNTNPYPIVPKVIRSLPLMSGEVAHGAVPVSVTQTSVAIGGAFASNGYAFTNSTISGVDPATAARTVFPTTRANIATYYGPDGAAHQTLVVLPGQFRSAASGNPAFGTFVEDTSANYLVTYSTNLTDFVGPSITQVQAFQIGSNTAFVVHANDNTPSADTVKRVFALVRLTDNSIVRVELANSVGDEWTGSISGTNVAELVVYALDGNGNASSATNAGPGYITSPPPTAPSGVDATGPSIFINVPGNPPAPTYLLNQVVKSDFFCFDAGSGLAGCTGPANVNTSSVNNAATHQTFTVNASDNAGNTSSRSNNYDVRFAFSGFFQPVNNPTSSAPINGAKAGQAIPVKWLLADANGAGVADTSSFVSLISTNSGGACAGSPTDAIESYTSGSSGLQYLGSGNWQFTWKTPSSWAGQCRTLTLTLKDGTTHTAYFRFR